MFSTGFWIRAFVSCLVTGILGGLLNEKKGRDFRLGFVIGFFLSAIGVLIVAVLPQVEEEMRWDERADG